MMIETKHKPLILDYTVWQDGQTGSVSGFGQNGSTSENYRVLGTDPWGKETVVWEARPDATSGADGGWNATTIAIDNSKMYRVLTWVKRNSNSNGRFYLGCRGYGSTNGVLLRSSGSNSTNPYFWTNITFFDIEQWYLVVGHIWPAGSGTGSQFEDSGIYTVQNGKVGNISHDFVWREESTSGRHRSYLYYATDTSQRQQWVYPRFDICDGTEPSIADLLSGFDSNNIDYIRSKGGTTAISFNPGKDKTYFGECSEVGPTNGLVAWYPLRNDTKDYTIQRNDGTNNGAAPAARGYEFTRSQTQTIELPGFEYIDTGQFSWSVWVNLYSLSEDQNQINSRGILDSWSGSRTAFFVGVRQNLLRWFVNRSDENPATSIPFANIDEWFHLVGTYNRYHGERNTFINGVNVLSENIEDAKTDFSLYRIGRGNNGSSHFDGLISDVRIYNRALSEEEINILYEITNPESNTKMKVTPTTTYIKGQFKEN